MAIIPVVTAFSILLILSVRTATNSYVSSGVVLLTIVDTVKSQSDVVNVLVWYALSVDFFHFSVSVRLFWDETLLT